MIQSLEQTGLHSDCLLVLLGNLGGNSVHIGGSFLGKGLSNDAVGSIIVLNGNLSDESGDLELLEAISDVLSCGFSVVLGACSVSLV